MSETIGSKTSSRSRHENGTVKLTFSGRRQLLAGGVGALAFARFARTQALAAGPSDPGATGTTHIAADQREMPDQRISSRTVAVEHVTIKSGKAFASVKAKLETILPPVDNEVFSLLRRGETAEAVARMNAEPTLSIFSIRDHGDSLMGLAGQTRGAIQYEIGNSLTASKMTREVISAALYAPVRVLLREDGDGVVAFEYDRPVSVFGQFDNARANIIAQQLDEHLQSALEDAAS